MKVKFESTRNKNITANPSNAILEGMSSDGGLYVLRELNKLNLDYKDIIKKDYIDMAHDIFQAFLTDFSSKELKDCAMKAYDNKFINQEITPLVNISEAHVLELFHGPTCAFKDLALSALPHFMELSLKKNNSKQNLLILTATSGDTGKAALEGFKNVDKIHIAVFYPFNGISKIQKLQMQTQEGNNVIVCGINGDFDDAQYGVKTMFSNEHLLSELLTKKNIKLSTANSINIGRLIPQIVYYFYAYSSLIKKGEIELDEKINFTVPTGNFGNILAGYLAKRLGLPVNKLICASNSNNILYDFLKTGIYDRKRELKQTISPSMDILISSNLERLIYYLSDQDNEYVKHLMNELEEKGRFIVKKEILEKIQENFSYGYASDDETEKTIKEVFLKDKYLLDPHTAVAYKVMLEQKNPMIKNVVLATASPYKFANSVAKALGKTNDKDEFILLEDLEKISKTKIPKVIMDIRNKPILHTQNIEKADMVEYILEEMLNEKT